MKFHENHFTILVKIILLLFIMQMLSQCKATKMDIKFKEYVSMMYQDGDISLVLNENNTFNIQIKKWDQKQAIHTNNEEYHGIWEIVAEDSLLLTENSGIKIKYKRSNVSMEIGKHKVSLQSWAWVSSSSPLKVDGTELQEKDKTDEFLFNSTK